MSIKTPHNIDEAKTFSRRVQQGKLRRIYKGVYTEDLDSSLEHVVLSNWMKIVTAVAPGAILSFRSAIELRPFSPTSSSTKVVILTGKHSKTVTLPGLHIKVMKGNPDMFCEAVLPNLSRSSEARALLENLSNTRKTKGIEKTLPIQEIEEYLASILTNRGESALNTIRDKAKGIAPELNLEKAYSKLNSIISALLTSHVAAEDVLVTEYGRACSKNEPFDLERLSLFESLTVYLRRCVLKDRPFDFKKTSWNNLSFFESYFSNFIEGTEFLIDEAEDIVYSGKTFQTRYADTHDILSLFHLASDLSEMTTTPETPEHLEKLLKERHASTLAKRPDKNPGQFKQTANRAGSTIFVEPSKVRGTLAQAFSLYETLEHPLAKAIFMMFVISEIHPFDDGNGRVARLMMNAELSRCDQTKIIIPTVHRDNYLGGLRRATRQKIFQTYGKILDQAQAYTASIDWSDYAVARNKLESDAANLTADEGLPIFYRALKSLPLSKLPID